MALRQEVLVVGDLNMDMSEEGGRAPDRHMSDFADTFGLHQLIKSPTRPVSGTLLDVILTNSPCHFTGAGTVDFGLSDHCLVYVVRKSAMPKPEGRIIEYRSTHNVDKEAFLGDLARVPWDRCYALTEADDVLESWMAQLNGVIDAHMPLRRKTVRADHLPWINANIRVAIAQRNRLSKKYLRAKTPENLRLRNDQRNLVTKLKRDAKKAYFTELCGGEQGPALFWSKLKPVLPASRSKVGISCLMHDGRALSSKKEIAEALNDYFVCSGQVADIENVDSQNHPSIGCIKEHWPADDFEFRLCTPDQVSKVLKRLKQRKSGGLDGISTKVLRLAEPVLANEVCKLLNCFIAKGVFPTGWKDGLVSAVPKGNDAVQSSNYRPVTLLSVLSKVFEKMLFDQLYGYFVPKLGTQLSGFLKGHSCATALLKMTEDWRWALDDGQTTAAVAIDLSKAFDSINHELLLAKLAAYGVKEHSMRLLGSYLNGRRQRVRIDREMSSWRNVTKGVPQGSLLGPLLFNIYVNDVTKFCQSAIIRLYADDTTLYCSDVDQAALAYRVNQGVDSLTEWFNGNGNGECQEDSGNGAW
jgi:hypothetical protein